MGYEFDEQHKSGQLSVMISEQSVDEMDIGFNRLKKPRAKPIKIYIVTEVNQKKIK